MKACVVGPIVIMVLVAGTFSKAHLGASLMGSLLVRVLQ